MSFIDSIAAILFIIKGYNKDIISDEKQRKKSIINQLIWYFSETTLFVNPIDISDIK